MSLNFRTVRTPAMFSNMFNSFIGKSMYGSTYDQGTIEYEKLKQSVAESTILIKNNINRIEKFNSICGKPSDCIAKRKQIFEIKNSVIIKTEATCKDLRAIYNLAKHDEKKLKLEVEVLIKEFKGVVKSFFVVQKKFLYNVKKNPLKDEPPNYEILVTRKSNLWNRKLNIVEEESVDEGAGASTGSSKVQEKQQVQKEFVVVPESIEELQRRQEAFELLEADMVDINAMMKEMGQMVITQGEGITNVEEHVEVTAVHVEETTQLLREARQYSDKRRARVAAIGGSIIITIILLIVLLKIFI